MNRFLLSLRHYLEEQPELAVWCLLSHVHTFILDLGGFQQYLWVGNQDAFLYVDLPGS